MSVGFIGLGNMGLPMALNMVRAGTPLLVWNRSRDKAELVGMAGATVADSPAHVFRDARTVFLMLANGTVIDEVLDRYTPRFAQMVAGRTLVQMGTTEASYSERLSEDTTSAGGRYVEGTGVGVASPRGGRPAGGDGGRSRRGRGCGASAARAALRNHGALR